MFSCDFISSYYLPLSINLLHSLHTSFCYITDYIKRLFNKILQTVQYSPVDSKSFGNALVGNTLAGKYYRRLQSSRQHSSQRSSQQYPSRQYSAIPCPAGTLPGANRRREWLPSHSEWHWVPSTLRNADDRLNWHTHGIVAAFSPLALRPPEAVRTGALWKQFVLDANRWSHVLF